MEETVEATKKFLNICVPKKASVSANLRLFMNLTPVFKASIYFKSVQLCRS